MKPIFIALAITGIYLWMRRIQDELSESVPKEEEEKAEAIWASEGGGNPSALV
jgi:hypothetical protein